MGRDSTAPERSVKPKIVAFDPALARQMGDVKAALLLCQLRFWSTRTTHEDGWFWKTSWQLYMETGLTKKEQARARAVLKSAGMTEEKSEGFPRRVWFRCTPGQVPIKGPNEDPQDPPKVTHAVPDEGSVSAETSPQKDPSGKASPYLTESTSEITTETTHTEPQAVEDPEGVLGPRKNKSKPKEDLIQHLHLVWQEAVGSAGGLEGKVGTRRRKDHAEALNGYSVEVCEQLLRGLGLSDHHMQGGFVEPSYAYRPTNYERFTKLGTESNSETVDIAEIMNQWRRLFDTATREIEALPVKSGLAGSDGQDGYRLFHGLTVPVYEDMLVSVHSVNLGATRHVAKLMADSPAAQVLCQVEIEGAELQLKYEIEGIRKRA